MFEFELLLYFRVHHRRSVNMNAEKESDMLGHVRSYSFVYLKHFINQLDVLQCSLVAKNFFFQKHSCMVSKFHAVSSGSARCSSNCLSLMILRGTYPHPGDTRQCEHESLHYSPTAVYYRIHQCQVCRIINTILSIIFAFLFPNKTVVPGVRKLHSQHR